MEPKQSGTTYECCDANGNGSVSTHG
jgi:hypothetical protein